MRKYSRLFQVISACRRIPGYAREPNQEQWEMAVGALQLYSSAMGVVSVKMKAFP